MDSDATQLSNSLDKSPYTCHNTMKFLNRIWVYMLSNNKGIMSVIP